MFSDMTADINEDYAPGIFVGTAGVFSKFVTTFLQESTNHKEEMMRFYPTYIDSASTLNIHRTCILVSIYDVKKCYLLSPIIVLLSKIINTKCYQESWMYRR